MGEDGKSYFLKLNSKHYAVQGTGNIRSKFSSNLSFYYNVRQLIIRI